jgi:hypothetical protein
MTADRPAGESLLGLMLDLFSARVLVWMASVGRPASLTPEAHSYFFDRYSRIAHCHQRNGRMAQARRYQGKAEEHRRRMGGGDGPPYAAAMAMPRPRRWLQTDAVSRNRFEGPDDAA